mmetsp:Transcript_168186/g.540315  ORF Transcript_168186/g.540315 Transcript_168186/m.540315 type:complete len:328 (+) Transcript_168186:63-1046(+)
MASISESYQQRGGASDEEAWAKELLAAMQANHEENEEECYGYPLVAEGAELKSMLPQLKARVQRLTPLGLSCIVCNLSLLMYQLRAWYTAGVGLLLVALLEKVAAQQNKLPSPPSKADPGMGALKLLEGVLLMCTALHAPVKVAELVEKMLRRRRLPPCVSARLEAAIVFLRDEEDMPGVPPTVKLTEDACETFLENLALSLVPQPEIVERVSQAKAAIQEAVQLVFSGSRLEFFGSSVNGFETQASDVDCVVLLSRAMSIKGQWYAFLSQGNLVDTQKQLLQGAWCWRLPRAARRSLPSWKLPTRRGLARARPQARRTQTEGTGAG